jgi:hypothetical protein
MIDDRRSPGFARREHNPAASMRSTILLVPPTVMLRLAAMSCTRQPGTREMTWMNSNVGRFTPWSFCSRFSTASHSSVSSRTSSLNITFRSGAPPAAGAAATRFLDGMPKV